MSQPYPQYPQQPPQMPQQPYPPPQGYTHAQYQPAAPPPPPVNATLDDFFGQPSSGGGPSLKFTDKPDGYSYSGVVARPITKGDVQQQTEMGTNRPATYRDGRPKLVMLVPLDVPASQEHPDGRAVWYVRGQARDDLVRAMAEAGAPAGPPEAGARITVTRVGTRPVPNMSPAIQYRVTYARPTGAEAVAQQPPVAVAQPALTPVEQAVTDNPATLPAGLSPEQNAALLAMLGQQQS